MKKAKVMLAVIAGLGLAGGVLAFKAHQKFSHALFYATTTVPGHSGTLYCTTAVAQTTVNGSELAGTNYSTLTTAIEGLTYSVNGQSQTEYCTTTVAAYPSLGE